MRIENPSKYREDANQIWFLPTHPILDIDIVLYLLPNSATSNFFDSGTPNSSRASICISGYMEKTLIPSYDIYAEQELWRRKSSLLGTLCFVGSGHLHAHF